MARLRWTSVRTTALASSLAAVVAACGVSGKQDAPPPPPATTSGGTGSGAPDGGAAGGGGATDGTGGATGGTSTAPPATGGGGTAAPGDGSGGGPTAQGGGGGTTGGTPSGGASGGVAPSGGPGTPAPAGPCDGLLPALSQPVDVILDGPDGCIAATTDPAGHVALGVQRATPTTGDELVMLPYGADGTPQGTAMPVFATSPVDLDGWFHWTSSGWRGLVRDPGATFSLRVRTWDARGTPLALTESGVRSIAPDGSGGSVALTATGDPATEHHLVWIDANGGVTRSAAVDDDPAKVLVDWSTGHVFALVSGSSVRATKVRWFGADGAPLTDWTDLHVSKGSGSSTHVLVDGTVVVNGPSQDWVKASPDAGGVTDVPAWLAARPRTRLATIRGGRGYAVLPMTGADHVEIVTASGEGCGTLTIPGPTVTGGQARLDVGQDGTLLLTSGTNPNDAQRRCEFRWWPALLR